METLSVAQVMLVSHTLIRTVFMQVPRAAGAVVIAPVVDTLLAALQRELRLLFQGGFLPWRAACECVLPTLHCNTLRCPGHWTTTQHSQMMSALWKLLLCLTAGRARLRSKRAAFYVVLTACIVLAAMFYGTMLLAWA